LSDSTTSDQGTTTKRPPRYSEARPKTRVRGGKRALPTAHSQSVWARLFRDVQGAVVQHCGGEQHVSETQRLAIRRVAALEAELIYLEDNFACERTAGNVPNPQDLTLYATMANAQRRFCEALGWRPIQRDVTTPLSRLLDEAARSARETAADEFNGPVESTTHDNSPECVSEAADGQTLRRPT
jgi:hypothetical protein